MARYKNVNYDQVKLLPVSYAQQILPGTFEYTLSYVIDHELNLSCVDDRYRNDVTGAPAYDPRILLKIILYAYSRGIISSREIERLCRDNIVMMALSADTQPSFVTIADFVASSSDAIARLFQEVLLVCDAMGLIGKELFAIDGCKLSSNASKEWSGTKADLKKKQQKIETAIAAMLARHRDTDAAAIDASTREREQASLDRLRANVRKIKAFLKTHDENRGPAGTIRQSNITDPESAKMKTSHGVLQGYNGVTAVDGKHQVIVHAEAFGEGQEHYLLKSMIDGVRQRVKGRDETTDVFQKAKLTVDAGFHSEANMKYVFEEGIDAYIADKQFRKRDPRFATAGRHQERTKKDQGTPRLFRPRDFTYDETTRTCVCPAGKRL